MWSVNRSRALVSISAISHLLLTRFFGGLNFCLQFYWVKKILYLEHKIFSDPKFISDVIGPILNKLFVTNFFEGRNFCGPNFFSPKFCSGPIFFVKPFQIEHFRLDSSLVSNIFTLFFNYVSSYFPL